MNNSPQIAVTLRTKRDVADFQAAIGERLLFAGLRNGFDLPYECVSGACGSCQALPLNASAGALENVFPNARAAAGLPVGRILMCQTTCYRDVEVRLFSRLAKLPDGEISPNYFAGSIGSIRNIASNTIAFSLQTETPVAYQAGQFVMLSVDGVPGYRAYSMTEAPRGSRQLTFVVKTVPHGAFSQWIIDDAQSKNRVQIFGPLGRAVFRADDRKEIFVIAGGTGIAGIMSILEQALKSGYLDRHSATLVFGVKTMSEAFFLDRLSSYVTAGDGRVEVIVAVSSEPRIQPPTEYRNLRFVPGLVVDVAEQILAVRADHHGLGFFLAGPPVVVENGVAMLSGHFSVEVGAIKFDRFQ